MQDVAEKNVKRMEVWYGLTILVAIALAVMPLLFGILTEEPDHRAGTLAGELARSLVDYHAESGAWPLNGDIQLDLTALGRRTATASNEPSNPLDAVNAGTPLMDEVPLDPWGRPFRAFLLGGGRVVAVVSTGPDGVLDTNIDRLWSRRDFPHPFDGDDAGHILALANDGGDR